MIHMLHIILNSFVRCITYHKLFEKCFVWGSSRLVNVTKNIFTRNRWCWLHVFQSYQPYLYIILIVSILSHMNWAKPLSYVSKQPTYWAKALFMYLLLPFIKIRYSWYTTKHKKYTFLNIFDQLWSFFKNNYHLQQG